MCKPPFWCPRLIPYWWIPLIGLLAAGCHHPVVWQPKPPFNTATTANDFDLTWNSNDPSGSPMNPKWAPQVQKPDNLPPVQGSDCAKTQPYQAGCTNQAKFIVKDQGAGVTGFLCTLFGDASSINGHADWTVASAQGAIGWLNYADDWDYNLLLVPNDDNGLTQNNNLLSDGKQRYIDIEFDSRELEGRFGTDWWKEFARLAQAGVTSGDYQQIMDYLHSGPGLACGTVYGVFGIDCEHGCRSEYHPAYAVAIQIDESKDSNRWAIFARNWGDEGFCSHYNHQLDLQSCGGAIRLLLPYNSRGAPISIKIEQAASSPAGQCPRFAFQGTGQPGEIVEIPLPPPGQDGLTELVVNFGWPQDAAPAPCKSVEKENLMRMLATRKAAASGGQAGQEILSEDRFGRLFRGLNQNKGFPETQFSHDVLQPYSSKAATAKQQLAQPKLSEQRSAAIQCQVPSVVTPEALTAPTPPPKKGKPSPLPQAKQKLVWDEAMMSSFCTAYVASGRRLPAGEPADLGAKLDKECKKYLPKK